VTEAGTTFSIDPAVVERLTVAVAAEARHAEARGRSPVLVCAGPLRAAVRRLVALAVPRLPVLAYDELGSQIRIETMGVVRIDEPATV